MITCHDAYALQSMASGSASGFDMTQSSIMSKGSGSATPYSLGGSLSDTPAAQAYVGQLSFNQQPFNQMYKVSWALSSTRVSPVHRRLGICLWAIWQDGNLPTLSVEMVSVDP